jgi:hypothetical protein
MKVRKCDMFKLTLSRRSRRDLQAILNGVYRIFYDNLDWNLVNLSENELRFKIVRGQSEPFFLRTG